LLVVFLLVAFLVLDPCCFVVKRTTCVFWGLVLRPGYARLGLKRTSVPRLSFKGLYKLLKSLTVKMMNTLCMNIHEVKKLKLVEERRENFLPFEHK